jgi:hypothetical protein
MVRNVAPTKNQGPSVTPRPKPEQDRAEAARLRGRAAQARQPVGRVVSNAPVVREPVTSRTGLPSIEETNRLLGRGGSTDYGADSDLAVPVIQQRRPSDINWQDSAYNTQIAALERALRDFETGTTTRGERYGQDFTTGLSRLGYQPASDFQAMPNIVEALNQPQAMARGMSVEEGAPAIAVAPVAGGRFDIEGQMDRTSAAARGTRGMRDEFAGRGTLRSSDFAKGFGDFQNRLGQQLQAMETGRGRFAEDLATELSQFRARTGEQKAAAEESARNRAIMRSIQEMGF